MYCIKCGQKNQDDALFCYKCGNRLISDNSKEQDIPATIQNCEKSLVIDNAELRKGTSIYINRILQLEFICKKLSEDIVILDNEIAIKRSRWGWKCYSVPNLFTFADRSSAYYLDTVFPNGYSFCLRGGSVHFCFGFHYIPDKNTFYAIIYLNGVPNEPYPVYSHVWYELTDNKENFSLFTDENTKKSIKKGIFFAKEERIDSDTIWNTKGCWLDEYYYIFNNRELARKIWLDCYQDFLSHKDILIAEGKPEIEKLEKKRAAISKELEKAKEYLNKFYATNIIPSQARSLEAMYYICDYYNSSSESLSNILFHLDLNEIKTKLDNIIANQQLLLINQAIMIAQNNEIIQQQSNTLNQLSRMTEKLESISNKTAQIAENSFRAATWAEIAANNSETCAWIASAHYLKEL